MRERKSGIGASVVKCVGIRIDGDGRGGGSGDGNNVVTPPRLNRNGKKCAELLFSNRWTKRAAKRHGRKKTGRLPSSIDTVHEKIVRFNFSMTGGYHITYPNLNTLFLPHLIDVHKHVFEQGQALSEPHRANVCVRHRQQPHSDG